MSTTRVGNDDADASRRKIFIAVGLVTALLVALLVFWATRPGPPPGQQPRLEGALRAGSPEFAQAKERIAVDYIVDNDTLDSVSALGGRTITAQPTIRNFTGRTISGLELRAAILDLQGQPVRERTMIVIPNAFSGQTELEPNKFVKVNVPIEGVKKEETAANVRIELTGVRFK